MTVLSTFGLAESIKSKHGYAVLAYIDHPDGEVYVWSGVNTLRYDGQDWIGVGLFGKITGIGGSKKLGVRGVVFELSGIPAKAAELLNSRVRNRAAKAWIAGLTPSLKVNGEPWQVVDGLCDYQEAVPTTDGKALIRVIIAEPVFSLERAQNRAFTPQWLKGLYGDDVTGLDGVPGMRNKSLSWTRT